MRGENCGTWIVSFARRTVSTTTCGCHSRRCGRSQMWRHDPRDEDRRHERTADPRDRDREDSRERDSIDPRDVFQQGLALPRGREREHVYVDGERYDLRGSEVRTLATIGAFRV